MSSDATRLATRLRWAATVPCLSSHHLLLLAALAVTVAAGAIRGGSLKAGWCARGLMAISPA
jgi:hypothetical protein